MKNKLNKKELAELRKYHDTFTADIYDIYSPERKERYTLDTEEDEWYN